jgi:hypothetical protein
MDSTKQNSTSKPKLGAPVRIPDGKRVNVYLDQHSLAKAEKIGKGNVSAGIRDALKQAK